LKDSREKCADLSQRSISQLKEKKEGGRVALRATAPSLIIKRPAEKKGSRRYWARND